MNVHTNVRTAYVVNYRGADRLCHSAVLSSGKNTVHIEVEHRYSAGNAVNSHRIERGVDVENAVKQVDMLVDIAPDHVCEILSLQLVAVSARHKGEPRPAFAVLNAALLYFQVFVYCERNTHNCFYHRSHLRIMLVKLTTLCFVFY